MVAWKPEVSMMEIKKKRKIVLENFSRKELVTLQKRIQVELNKRDTSPSAGNSNIIGYFDDTPHMHREHSYSSTIDVGENAVDPDGSNILVSNGSTPLEVVTPMPMNSGRKLQNFESHDVLFIPNSSPVDTLVAIPI